ncbi:AmmeMemoRadiSam system protein A [Desulfoprunum benzoelyticum]|uniref:AmmeMemoRadiSam system protein A n=1 Tax=Desulfoprunum benzoelyticum TaxID=1506996 RepID=A0A840US36_9BACT|nr:AmmeMemoRadiSam system protein A [Desulfoprunum benzoelyticum]MBB5347483.1 AmmeMemoRadiSam system protein A [Desulfoprunum benzoelyticum]MBM9529639.1 AmmeMemoRadiSam system protein A [Desulfoprunum benzoelyticum]
MEFTNEQGQTLLKLARRTIASRLGRGEAPECGDDYRDLQQQRAVFVTLKKRGRLRGCIGNLEPVGPLWQGVRDNALNAAFNDFRFPPLTAEEIDEVHIDISILGPAVPLEYSDADDLLAKLQPGLDGVILRSGTAGATFLPQVWQQLPDPENFLYHLCRKAGLSGLAWRHSQPEILIYRVQSFEEE